MTQQVTPVDPANPNPNPAPPAPAATTDPDVLAAAQRTAAEETAKRREAEEKYERIRQEREAEEQARLQEEGEWKQLAERNNQRATEAQQAADARIKAANERIVTAELVARLAMEGVTDRDFHVLADRSKLSLNDSGEVVGLDQCVEDLKTRKPAIFGAPRAPRTTVAAPAPPPSDGSGPQPMSVAEVRALPKDKYDQRKNDFLRGLKRRA